MLLMQLALFLDVQQATGVVIFLNGTPGEVVQQEAKYH